VPDNRDAFYLKARAGFQRVIREYRNGRFYYDAQGWLAHLALRTGDRVSAMAEYYRMLGSHNEAARMEAVCSLRLIRHQIEDGEMARVEKLLENEPMAALAYAYYEIYNYAAPDLDYFCDYRGKPEFKEKENEVFRRIVAFATRQANRYESNAFGGAFVLRVAEANLRLDNFTDVARLARRALVMQVSGAIRSEALWVARVAEHHLKQFKTAREALTSLIKENPNNRYTEGARRNLAMLEEDAGNLDAALEQYLALDYRHDVAYFIDVLMTPEALKQFIDAHTDFRQRDELLYALGVRYLREFRWNKARQVYAQIRPTPREIDYPYFPRNGMDEAYREDAHTNAKVEELDPKNRGVRPQWVEMDLRTANELERLERDYNAAQDDEAKAEALYQLASYIYQGSLLFYNPLAWSGERHYLLYDYYNRGAFRGGTESQQLFDYMQQHDMASRALGIYLDVVKKYPNTRSARDALYTAAVCHERLGDYNNYWRDIYANGGRAGERLVTYKEVKRAFPDYRFPLGTFGWEPATRTVNGGPGWAELPKPKPKPTVKERVLSRSKIILKKLAKKARKSVRFWVSLHVQALQIGFKITLGLLKCLWFGCAFVFSCLMVG
jgi:TolA-binding protein